MACVGKANLEICKGATFSIIVRWESSTCIFKPITNITKSAPPVLSVTGHGVPDKWRVAVTNVLGMKEINSPNNPPKLTDYKKSQLITADSLSIPCIDASGFTAYTSGGILWYNEPVDLTNYTARMHIRDSVDAASFLLELTTANGRIVVNNTTKTITLTVTATDTAAITFTSGVYDLEMVSPAGVVTRILEGNITVREEVTR